MARTTLGLHEGKLSRYTRGRSSSGHLRKRLLPRRVAAAITPLARGGSLGTTSTISTTDTAAIRTTASASRITAAPLARPTWGRRGGGSTAILRVVVLWTTCSPVGITLTHMYALTLSHSNTITHIHPHNHALSLVLCAHLSRGVVAAYPMWAVRAFPVTPVVVYVYAGTDPKAQFQGSGRSASMRDPASSGLPEAPQRPNPLSNANHMDFDLFHSDHGIGLESGNGYNIGVLGFPIPGYASGLFTPLPLTRSPSLDGAPDISLVRENLRHVGVQLTNPFPMGCTMAARGFGHGESELCALLRRLLRDQEVGPGLDPLALSVDRGVPSPDGHSMLRNFTMSLEAVHAPGLDHDHVVQSPRATKTDAQRHASWAAVRGVGMDIDASMVELGRQLSAVAMGLSGSAFGFCLCVIRRIDGARGGGGGSGSGTDDDAGTAAADDDVSRESVSSDESERSGGALGTCSYLIAVVPLGLDHPTTAADYAILPVDDVCVSGRFRKLLDALASPPGGVAVAGAAGMCVMHEVGLTEPGLARALGLAGLHSAISAGSFLGSTNLAAVPLIDPSAAGIAYPVFQRGSQLAGTHTVRMLAVLGRSWRRYQLPLSAPLRRADGDGRDGTVVDTIPLRGQLDHLTVHRLQVRVAWVMSRES